MAKIAFILLAHRDPEGIIRQAERLTAAGDRMAIHFDGRAAKADYARLRAALDANPSVVFAKRRVKCGWGEWSLVAGTLEAVRAAVDTFPDATHFYMLSGDCMPIKSAEYGHDFLDAEDCDYIESFDFFSSDWIKTGMKGDRLHYRHFFNERKHKKLFYASYEFQKRHGLKRRIPGDLSVMIGSQWWCLRRRTIEWVLDFVRNRRDVMRFFRSTWIPDETFFQTIVRHVVPGAEIRSRPLTFLMFSDYGMPVTFYNDHYDLLLAQDYLFARKISPEARDLKRRLGDLFAARDVRFDISNEGRRLYSYLTGRGREGRRYAERFWSREATIGPGRELLVVVCKKWHVAKRLIAELRRLTGIPAVEYLFNEQGARLPGLGGFEARLDRRTRHPRLLLRMLFDHYAQDRLVICMDPADMGLLEDLAGDAADVRVLEIDCSFSDAYLVGHAQRTGLAGAQAPQSALEALLPTIREDLRHEREAIGRIRFARVHRLREVATPAENAVPLAAFLAIPEAAAAEIAATHHLFSD